MNADLANHIKLIAECYTLSKDPNDVYRAKTYNHAYATISNRKTKINSSKDINTKGIGTSVKADIDSFLTTGTTSRYESIKHLKITNDNKNDINTISVNTNITSVNRFSPSSVKPSANISTCGNLTSIHSIGVKTAQKLEQKGITNVTDLNSSNVNLTHAQKIGLKYKDEFSIRINRSEIDQIKSTIRLLLPSHVQFEIAGSYRRGCKTSGDIDILVKSNNNNISINMNNILHYLKSLITDHITPNANVKYMGVLLHNNIHRHLDIRLIPQDSWITGLLYFTGSKEFNVLLRNRALTLGYSLSEYSLKNLVSNDLVKIEKEEDIFNILGVRYYSPNERLPTLEELDIIQ